MRTRFILLFFIAASWVILQTSCVSSKPGSGDEAAWLKSGKEHYEKEQYDKAIQDHYVSIALKPQEAITCLDILEICIIAAKPEQFKQWLSQFETAIPESKLSKDFLIIKLYLVCLNKCVLNEPRTEIENRLGALLKEKIELSWSFELTDEWLDNPKNGLTPEQVKYMRGLTDKVKTSQKNLK